jgi:hypothetical protein
MVHGERNRNILEKLEEFSGCDDTPQGPAPLIPGLTDGASGSSFLQASQRATEAAQAFVKKRVKAKLCRGWVNHGV